MTQNTDFEAAYQSERKESGPQPHFLSSFKERRNDMDGIIMEVYDATEPVDPDVERMREGVDDDGLTDASEVETRYCEIKNVIPADGYLRIIGDDDFTDVEIRILHKTLEALGWKRESSPSLP